MSFKLPFTDRQCVGKLWLHCTNRLTSAVFEYSCQQINAKCS
ncbi:RIKEN cDNA 1110020P15, isoform CRA_c [Mus musculus]|nr:RIKEN cDNA 1110020P15, isoform CRA_c [Mus musculus]